MRHSGYSIKDCEGVIFPKVTFHTPENHHLHHNLCLLACQHFENIRLFQVTQPSLAVHNYFYVLLMGYKGLSLTITRMCA